MMEIEPNDDSKNPSGSCVEVGVGMVVGSTVDVNVGSTVGMGERVRVGVSGTVIVDVHDANVNEKTSRVKENLFMF